MARVKYYDQASQEWKYADAALNMKGKDGYTPQKGIDYFTEEDVRELTENVLDQGVLTYNEQELTEDQKAQARENIGIDQISFDKLTEDLDASGFRITNLPIPQSGSEPATKDFVENFTIEGSTYVATDDGDGNVTIRPYLADEDELVFKSHIQNQNNPHGVTAAQAGARSDTWMPTAEEVGATPLSHAVDKSNPHDVTAEQIGALPSTGGDMTGDINMNGQKLSGLNAPTADNDAATKGYVDTNKVDKTNVVNNFTTTEEGFVADARALKVLNDKFEESSGVVTLNADYGCKYLRKGNLMMVSVYNTTTSILKSEDVTIGYLPAELWPSGFNEIAVPNAMNSGGRISVSGYNGSVTIKATVSDSKYHLGTVVYLI